jgi:hypothetical protein
MAVLSSAVSALSSFYPKNLDPHKDADVEISIIRLLAKLPTLGAYFYKRSIGQPYLYPDNSLTLVENFLRLTFGLPAEEYKVDPAVAKALDMLFILHADHEQNCSTSTARVVGSSEANVFASISAAVHALSGPLHGGANAAVLDMLEDIRDHRGDVNSYVTRVKNKEPGVKLMGFGHRVYKNYDPRARIVKTAADELLTKLAPNDHLLELAMQLEEVALSDDYFISRKLYPNVDFYTGLIYRAVRDRPAARLARALQGDAARPGDQDRPPAPGLHRPGRARVRRRREAVGSRSAAVTGGSGPFGRMLLMPFTTVLGRQDAVSRAKLKIFKSILGNGPLLRPAPHRGPAPGATFTRWSRAPGNVSA